MKTAQKIRNDRTCGGMGWVGGEWGEEGRAGGGEWGGFVLGNASTGNNLSYKTRGSGRAKHRVNRYARTSTDLDLRGQGRGEGDVRVVGDGVDGVSRDIRERDDQNSCDDA